MDGLAYVPPPGAVVGVAGSQADRRWRGWDGAYGKPAQAVVLEYGEGPQRIAVETRWLVQSANDMLDGGLRFAHPGPMPGPFFELMERCRAEPRHSESVSLNGTAIGLTAVRMLGRTLSAAVLDDGRSLVIVRSDGQAPPDLVSLCGTADFYETLPMAMLRDRLRPSTGNR